MTESKSNKPAKALMIVGTSSDAGKSFIAAALCRYFTKAGLKVAPFKAQNMSRNAYQFPDGRQISKVQANQALACGVKAQLEMNPILLKPTADRQSELIVMGESKGLYKASEYFNNKEAFWPVVESAYQKLAMQHELIIVEGAGSPAEINLLENDFVNLGLAKRLGIPAILVGDIERGGVFAAVYGTYKILAEDLQKQLKAYLINRFRGDLKILEPGIDLLAEKLELPCLGVVPYCSAYLEPEDSLSAAESQIPAELKNKNLSPEDIRDFYSRELDRAADAVVSALNMEELKKIIGLD
ncbi:MAG: cobyric acid synthase [Eubacteriales bacterium]|nr:cobyric acid synthase [Eubacteriales bacterium]